MNQDSVSIFRNQAATIVAHGGGWSLPEQQRVAPPDSLSWSSKAPRWLKSRVPVELKHEVSALWDSIAASAVDELSGRPRSDWRSTRVLRRILIKVAVPIAFVEAKMFDLAATQRVPSDSGAVWIARAGGGGAAISGQAAAFAIGPSSVIVDLCTQAIAGLLDDYAAACVRRNRYDHSGRAASGETLARYVSTLHDPKTITESETVVLALIEWLIDEIATRTVQSLAIGAGIYFSVRQNTQTVRKARADDLPLPPVTEEEIKWVAERGAPDAQDKSTRQSRRAARSDRDQRSNPGTSEVRPGDLC